MRILFVMRHPAAVRSLSDVLRMLDARGHRVHLAFGGIKADAHGVLQRLSDECPGITFGSLPSRGSPGWVRSREGWNALARRLRLDSDYLRYLEPSYANAPALRARAAANAHPVMRKLARLARLAGPRGVRGLRKAVEAVERCLLPPPHVERFLIDQQPDVVLATHLARDSVQVDYVRAARRLGIHTAYPVFSWDNLTNKGLVHELPDLVLVWNELQADEAVELQSLPRERVRVLGAWSYDHWFAWEPSRNRDEFCNEVRLRADRPIVLYVCSSGFVAPDEVAFVRRWIDALRARGGALAEAGILVRPHPRNAAQWSGSALDLAQVTVWPAHGEEPLEASSRQNYFDSIYHSAAVVGINTSAQIEGAVVGRPVHTVLAEEFEETQQGTLHFQYLRADDFGHLYVGRTMEEHLEQLEDSLRGRRADGRNERFLRRFVRPFGLDVAATPRYVEAVEELAARAAPAPDRGPRLAAAVRLALRPLAARAGRRAEERKSAKPTSADDVRAVIRTLRRERVDARVVAGPWLGDELGEILYWIPFLRWAQAATYGLRDRLVVLSRASGAALYAGLGSQHVAAEDALSTEQLSAVAGTDDVVFLAPSLVDERRAQLAAGDPDNSFLRRRLEFAPLVPPALPDGLALPDEFVAVRFGADQAELASAFGARFAIVDLAGLERGVQLAVLARAGAFVGTYGVEAYLAVLVGVQAVAFATAHVAGEDLQVVASFLARPPFGRLDVIERGPAAADGIERAVRLLEAPTEELARV
jgi:hypothetical protein